MPRIGGGFGRGFSGGGGSSGGGFGRGGGFGGHHHHHHHFGFYHRPYGFGFFGGGLLGLILAPIFVILFALLFLGIYLYSTITIIANGGQLTYDEEKLAAYATSEYEKSFNKSEDEILITFLTTENNHEYCCIAICGKNINTKIVKLFSSEEEQSEALLPSVIEYSLSESYKYSLDLGLADIVDEMKYNINELDLNSSYRDENHVPSRADSKLINYTDLSMDESIVNESLDKFTEATGIPMVIAVEKAENVFDKTMPTGSIILIIALIALIIVCIVHIVKKVREKKSRDRDFSTTAGTSNKSNTFDGLDNDTFK